MKTSFEQTPFLSFFFVLIFSFLLYGNKFSVEATDWNAINSRAYHTTSNSNQYAYIKLRELKAYPQYFDNFGSWQNFILPQLQSFVNQAKTSNSTKIQAHLTQLHQLATELESLSTNDPSFSNKKVQFSRTANKLSEEIKRLQKSKSKITEAIKFFSDGNDAMSHTFQQLPNWETYNINPSLSTVQNAIGKVRGVANAIQDDLAFIEKRITALESADLLLVDLEVSTIKNAWNTLKDGIAVFGKNMTAKAWNINVVEYASGRFYQSGTRQWKEESQNRSQAFVELNRDENSIYLYDKSRDYYLRLDLWTNKIHLKSGTKGQYGVLYPITKTSNRTNGTLLNGVVCDIPNTSKIQYVKRGDTWVEKHFHSANTNFTFTEVGRDAFSVYLNDFSRGISIQLDVHKMKVKYGKIGQAKKDLYNITYSY